MPLRARPSLSVLLVQLLCIFVFPVGGRAALPDCNTHTPKVPGAGVRIEPGVVDSQIGIDFDAKGPARFERRTNNRLIEIERLWGNGAKTILPEPEGSERAVAPKRGKFVGAHIAFYLKSKEVSGVNLWSLEFSGTDLFIQGEWSLDGVPLTIASPIVIERGTVARWRTLTVKVPGGLSAKEPVLSFYARTIFHRPWHPKNIASGSRVDACAWFYFED